MGEMAADRVYGDRREETVAYVASSHGVATVRVAGDRVGRFGLVHRCVARDLASRDGRLYVATDEGVLGGHEEFKPTGFGRTGVAVTVDVDTDDDTVTVLAADDGGTVSRLCDGEWTALGDVPEVRSLSGDMVAASDGLYRVVGGALEHVGLSDARDVTTGGAPLAATDDGLYRLGPGWTRDSEGAFTMVGADAGGQRAHAATAETLDKREAADWRPVDLPVDEQVVDVAYGECAYAVTRDGTFLVEATPEDTADGTGGWRSRALGLPDVTAVAVA